MSNPAAIPPPPTPPPPSPPPPRAFAQGAGLVFQIAGCTLFLIAMFICCGSTLLSKDFATRSDLTKIAFLGYSAQRAITICLFASIFFGIALAGVGLGMQADHRPAPLLAVGLTLIATFFWSFHLLFAAAGAGSILFSIVAGALTAGFVVLLALAIGALRDMRKNPPEKRHDILPAGYKIPYSHYHDEPPEVRLAAELEQRRQRLAVQQKELEALEEKIKKKLD